MKAIYFILFCSLLPRFSSIAQNRYFFPFGIPKTAVQDSLAKFQYIQHHAVSKNRELALWQDRWVEYLFHEDKLYSIHSGIIINDRREAKEITQMVELYFHYTSLGVNHESSSTRDQEWIAFKCDRWEQFFKQKYKKYFRLELCSYSLKYTPETVREKWIDQYLPADYPYHWVKILPSFDFFTVLGRPR